MTEELYVNIGGVWRELELQQPSGITFEFKSTLFSDITKVTSNKTYTFTLPGTAKNNLTLQNLSDLRHTSKVLGAKLPCIYKINGMNFINNPNLYISQVAKDKSYKAIMSWGGVIMEEDVNLNELKEGSVVIFKEDWMEPTAGKWANFNSNADDVIYPWYSCGVPTHNLYVTETYTIEGQEGEYYTRTSAPPLPVISVYNILTEIEKRYALKFDFKKQYTKTQWENGTDNGGCEIVNKGVVPITNLNVSDSDVKSFSIVWTIGFVGSMPIMGSDNGNQYEIPEIRHNVRLGFSAQTLENDYFLSSNLYTLDKDTGFFEFKRTGYLQNNVSIRIKGKITINFDSATNVIEKMKFLNLRQYKDDKYEYGQDYEGEITDNKIIFDFTGDKAIELSDMSGSYGFWFISKTELNKLSTLEQISYKRYSRDSLSHIKNIEGELTIAPVISQVMNMNTIRPIKPWSKLPEISCKDFVKSLFYIAGGFPVVNSDGSIGLAFFNDIKKNMQSGKIYNWTDYLLNKKDYTVKYSDGSLGINNYYLMKNESLEKTKDKEEDDVYNSHFARLSCDNMSLPTQKTICTLPYYTQYIKDSVNPDLETGNTFKFYRWRNGKLETVEAKPSIGVLTKETNSFLEGVFIWNTLGMETFQFPQDLEHDERYAYFAKIIKNPQYVECSMKIPIQVLTDIDFAKPIYIEQFNSLFVATDIRYTSKTGISTVSLIKIPTN